MKANPISYQLVPSDVYEKQILNSLEHLKNQPKKDNNNNDDDEGSGCLGFIIILLALGAVFYWFTSDNKATKEQIDYSETENKILLPTVPFPENGTIEYHCDRKDRPKKRHNILLNVKNSNSNIWVKIKDKNMNDYMSVFIEKNKSHEFYMPKGDYYFRYCTGENWYGKEYSFGEGTTSCVFDREIRNGGGTYILKTVTDGNLIMETLDPKDF